MTELLNPPATREPIVARPYHRHPAERTTPAVRPLRVAWLTNEIPPYRVPFYQELSETPDWDFQIFTCVDRENDRLWDIEHDMPFATRRSFSLSYMRRRRHPGPDGFADRRQVHLPVGLFWDLCRFKPDVLISGEFGARTLIAALYARLFNRRLVVSFEGTPHTERDIKPIQRRLRRMIRRAPRAYTVDGRQGREYLQSMSIPARSIFEIGQAIDADSFADQLSADERHALRNELGICGHCYLFCGALITRKGIDQLLDAWEVFAKNQDATATLLVVGEGPERARLEKRVTNTGLSNVKFVGHLQRHRLPAIYHAADVFVFPTLEDCWALAVNEAMAAGLPVINSKYTGSADMIVEGENGWVIDPLNRDDLLRGLRLAWEVRDDRWSMGAAARRSVAAMSVPAVAERVRRVVDHVRSSIPSTSGVAS